MKTLSQLANLDNLQLVKSGPENGKNEEKNSQWYAFCLNEKIDKIYQDVKFQEIKMVHPLIYPVLCDWLTPQPKRPSILLHGGVGSGKTYAALCLLRVFFESGTKWLRFLGANQIIEFGEKRGIESLKEIYGDVPILLVDDLGIEKPAEWQIKYFFELFNRRCGQGLTTIMTSNFDFNRLIPILTERVVSRMSGIEVKFPDEDFRRLAWSK